MIPDLFDILIFDVYYLVQFLACVFLVLHLEICDLSYLLVLSCGNIFCVFFYNARAVRAEDNFLFLMY